ncbi:MAG TPA: aldehyde dehydrogenase family protein [Kofleriaceae bacterium]|nr:aldehyde dehydrogenase family protein [Kofleriaceae bacterium]
MTSTTTVAEGGATPPMSAGVVSAQTTERKDLDEAVAKLRERARAFARMAVSEKAALLRACMSRIADAAEAWVATGSKAKGLRGDAMAEEWLAGPLPTLRMARLFADSLDAIAKDGRPPLGTGARVRLDGRVEVDVFPVSTMDRVAFAGFRGSVLLQAGVDRSEAARRQASFYRQRDPDGGVSLILGAGNVSSIPPMDVFSKLFVEGYVCLLKMNPVNEWSGPILERALAPLVDAGVLRIVYGGADVGKYLVEHQGIDDVHITGSDKTHDLIVWGKPGPERERRMASGEPLLKKPISSELGNVSPVVVVPADYDDDQLAFMAANVATQVTNNASFNCNAAKVLVTSRAWPQRDAFLGLVARQLGRTPARKAYYPGAFDRYARLTAGRDIHTPGAAAAGELPWTIIRGIDAGNRADPVFSVEPFCAILSDVPLAEGDPVAFLEQATRFCNETLWGTLNAEVLIAPKLEREAAVAAALERAVTELRYGTVAINHWPALGYAVGSMPWGGHPSSTLRDVQSGLGWVHNSFMLEGIDKAILRGPLTVTPRPLWFTGNPRAVAVARKMIQQELAPSWGRLARVVMAALW